MGENISNFVIQKNWPPISTHPNSVQLADRPPGAPSTFNFNSSKKDLSGRERMTLLVRVSDSTTTLRSRVLETVENFAYLNIIQNLKVKTTFLPLYEIKK